MKKLLFCTLLLLFIAPNLDAQGLYKQKKRRSDYFGGGAPDRRELTSYGLQLSFGPNYTFTSAKNTTHEIKTDDVVRSNYVQDPAGSPGVFVEIGMVHYRMKKPAFLERNIIHYLDWGIGFDYIGGKETTTINNLDNAGNIVSTSSGSGSYNIGYGYGRLTVHRLLKITEKAHLDYGLGVNANYAVMGQNTNYQGSVVAATQHFQNPFVLQIHAQLGINIKLRRGDYLVPGVWAPIVGAYEFHGGNPSIRWYSSSYWPVHFQLKWLHNFGKKSTGCNTGTEEDRKKNQEYMQNR